MSELIDNLMKAKAALAAIGPIQKEIELTPAEFAALKKIIPTVTVPYPSLGALRIRLSDQPDWLKELQNTMLNLTMMTKPPRPPFIAPKVDRVWPINPIT